MIDPRSYKRKKNHGVIFYSSLLNFSVARDWTAKHNAGDRGIQVLEM